MGGALVAGALIGYVQVRLEDLALAALFVGIVCAALGITRPQRPWRWALIVALCVPLVQLLAYLGHERFTRGATLGSVSLAIPAFSCAYGGSFGRKLLGQLFSK